MTPTVTLVREFLHFNIDGVEPRPVGLSSVYLPDECMLHYEPSAVLAKLFGTLIKKDGSLENAPAVESFWSGDIWPDWLWDLAAEHAPEWFTMPERAS